MGTVGGGDPHNVGARLVPAAPLRAAGLDPGSPLQVTHKDRRAAGVARESALGIFPPSLSVAMRCGVGVVVMVDAARLAGGNVAAGRGARHHEEVPVGVPVRPFRLSGALLDRPPDGLAGLHDFHRRKPTAAPHLELDHLGLHRQSSGASRAKRAVAPV
eukprot:CAMPEP_0182936082 /NCGR_PEP_ID=MMETSP0105_2-20130417/39547_1 /TAXON_ID=81532 ORGANISM="Acanthoeca-like sp., Strain 10tr" /NCGR_SAMPLE_ID=MMETSP0105_2 /ASSEMBLY_ACC=CAM_ASM_000205 /LENGTH=158 /DNA_ID=CAMNT_0025075147 /DNA_START=121 /DNA_END=599 /DNA_ORIENTATION=-